MKFGSLNNLMKDLHSAPRNVKHLFVFVLLVGAHSFLLGISIFFFTDLFYRFFFQSEIQNFFFVRQSGLFLLCLGLFNIAVLTDIKNNYAMIKIIIITKVLAFLFLVTNAHLAAHPSIIYIAGLGDGLMAVLLIFFYRRAISQATV